MPVATGHLLLQRGFRLQPQGGGGGRADDTVHLEATGPALELPHGGFGIRTKDPVDHEVCAVLVETALKLGDLRTFGGSSQMRV